MAGAPRPGAGSARDGPPRRWPAARRAPVSNLRCAVLVRGPAGVRVVRRLEAVPAQPGDADVVGVQRHDADAADQEQGGHRDVDPRRAGKQGERGGDGQQHDQVAPGQPAPPPGVGQLVPHPVPVPVGQPEPDRVQQLACRIRIPRQPCHASILPRPAAGPDAGRPLPRPAQPVIWQTAAPAATVWPTATARPVTVPSLCAVSGCSIFIASSTTITSPADTRCPAAAAILTIVPCIGLTSVSPPPAAGCPRRGPPPRARPAGLAAAPPRCGTPGRAGSTTSSRLPPTSTVIRSRGGGAAGSAACCGGSGAENSVSIQRVCTPRRSPAANAGSATTARWNGSTVGMPPISNSASARADRCSACPRLAPVTISLAISESNACGTVIPAAYPASSRTPGPDGGFQAVMVPGAGRKPRAGSSALIRNSIECPLAGGSP